MVLTGPQTPPAVAIVIPTLNEEQHLAACISSLQVDLPQDQLVEFWIADGGSSDRTRAITLELASSDARIRWIDNPLRTQSAALNLVARATSAEILVRADAHSIYLPGYVAAAVQVLKERSDVISVGGLPEADGATLTGKANAILWMSFWGSGGAAYRRPLVATSEPIPVDTVQFGAWRRHEFLAVGGYDTSFAINEDYELNIRLRRTGKKIVLTPAMRYRYIVRGSIAAILRQYGRYGFWKARTILMYPREVRLRQLLPAAAALCFVASILTGMVDPRYAALACAYLTLELGATTWIGRRTPRLIPRIFLASLSSHIAFGLGLILGLGSWRVRPRQRQSMPLPTATP